MPKSKSKRSTAKTGSSNGEASSTGAVSSTMNSADGPGKLQSWEITAAKRASGRVGNAKTPSKKVAASVEMGDDQERRMSINSQASTEERRLMELEAAGGDDDDGMPPPTIEDIMYAVNSFSAVMWPVALTMVLAGLAVVFVNDGSNGDGQGGALFPTPGTPLIFREIHQCVFFCNCHAGSILHCA
jgi:hypothetical protein